MTIAESVDASAGVKFSARHCFTMETLSIVLDHADDSTDPDGEIPLGDELWQQMLAKGRITGDERWMIGENPTHEVTILHFDKQVRSK